MNLLPDLALLEVFSFVSVEERFKTLRLVCRRWRQVVEFQAQQDLIVYEDQHPFKNRWPSDNRRIDTLSVVGTSFFVFCLVNGYCKTIRRLFLSLRAQWANGKLVDCMCQLEEFSIDQPSSALRWAPYSRENVSLDLDRLIFPNLRVLSVKQEFKAKATIIAHRLEKLVLWEFSFTQARGLTCKSDFE